MGKYRKKHQWGNCEFVYTYNFKKKKSGEACNARCVMRCDGKFFCSEHKPSRIAKKTERYRKKLLIGIYQREARLEARLKTLKSLRGISSVDKQTETEKEASAHS